MSMEERVANLENCKLASEQEDDVVAVTYKWPTGKCNARQLEEAYKLPNGAVVLNSNGCGAWSDYTKFAKVINEGTEEFKSMGLADVSSRIDFVRLAEAVLERTTATDKARGNLQLNYLFSGGENQRREEREIERHYGCALPYLNDGSEAWFHLAEEMSAIARKLKVPWAEVDYAQLSSFEERNDIFARSIGPNNVFEGITVALLELCPNSGKVNEHVDKLNCATYTHTLLFSEIVHVKSKIYRATIIAYMRKSCADTMVRRDACKEVANGTVDYLQKLPKSLMPQLSARSHQDYYQECGQLGLGLIVRKGPKKRGEDTKVEVKAVALLNKPHMDKPMSFISPITSMMLKLYDKTPMMTYRDLCLMSLSLGHLNGVFTLGCALSRLCQRETIEINGPLGALGAILEEIKELTGSYSGGGYPRCQVFWKSSVIDVGKTLEDCKVIENMCKNSSENPPPGVLYDIYCREKCYECVGLLKKKIYGVGEFGGHHMVFGLVQLGLLKPQGMLHKAKFAVQTATLKSLKVTADTPNPKMIRYLASGVQSARSDKAKRVMESVVPHLKRYRGLPWMTDSILEQVNCEHYRGKAVADFMFPFCGNKYLPFEGSEDSRCMWDMLPEMDPGTGRMKVCCSPSAFPTPRPKSGNLGDPPAAGVVATYTRDCEYMHCRIPKQYITCFDGLWMEIKSRFFPCCQGEVQKLSDITSWMENHDILGPLITHFMKSPMVLSENSIQRVTKTPEDFAHLAQDRFHHKKKAAEIGDKDEECCVVIDLFGEDSTADSTLTGTDSSLGGGPSNGSRKRKNTSLFPELEVLGNGEDPTNPLIVPSLDELHRPADAVPLKLAGTFGYYQFTSHVMCEVALRTNVPMLGTTKKLINLCRSRLQLSPINSEVKRSLFIGKPEDTMPVQLNKSTLKDIRCTSINFDWTVSSSTRSANTVLHMLKWTGHEMLPFFTVGSCCIVDKIAVINSAVKAADRARPGLYKWLFASVKEAKRFLFQCLMIVAGKPEYFANLFKRVWKLADKEGTLKALKDPQPLVVALDLHANELGVEPMFYAIFVKSPVESWMLGVNSGGESDLASVPLIIEPTRWKMSLQMTQFLPLPSSGSFSSVSSATRRRRRNRAFQEEQLSMLTSNSSILNRGLVGEPNSEEEVKFGVL